MGISSAINAHSQQALDLVLSSGDQTCVELTHLVLGISHLVLGHILEVGEVVDHTCVNTVCCQLDLLDLLFQHLSGRVQFLLGLAELIQSLLRGSFSVSCRLFCGNFKLIVTPLGFLRDSVDVGR